MTLLAAKPRYWSEASKTRSEAMRNTQKSAKGGLGEKQEFFPQRKGVWGKPRRGVPQTISAVRRRRNCQKSSAFARKNQGDFQREKQSRPTKNPLKEGRENGKKRCSSISRVLSSIIIYLAHSSPSESSRLKRGAPSRRVIPRTNRRCIG